MANDFASRFRSFIEDPANGMMLDASSYGSVAFQLGPGRYQKLMVLTAGLLSHFRRVLPLLIPVAQCITKFWMN